MSDTMVVRLRVPWILGGRPLERTLEPGARSATSGSGKTTLCRAVSRLFGAARLRGVDVSVEIDGQEYAADASKRARDAWPRWARTAGWLVAAPTEEMDGLLARDGQGLATLIASSGSTPVDVREARLAAEAARAELRALGPDPGPPPARPSDVEVATARRVLDAAAAARASATVEVAPVPRLRLGQWRGIEVLATEDEDLEGQVVPSWRVYVEALDGLRPPLVEAFRHAQAAAAAARREAESARSEVATCQARQVRCQAEEVAAEAALERDAALPVRVGAALRPLLRRWVEAEALDEAEAAAAALVRPVLCTVDHSTVADRWHEDGLVAAQALARARARSEAADADLTVQVGLEAEARAHGEALAASRTVAREYSAVEAATCVDAPSAEAVAEAERVLDGVRASEEYARRAPGGRSKWQVAAARVAAATQAHREAVAAARQDLDAIARRVAELDAEPVTGEAGAVALRWSEEDGEVRVSLEWDGHSATQASSGERVAAWAVLRTVLLERAGMPRPWVLVDDAQDWTWGFAALRQVARVVEFRTTLEEGS